MSDSLLSKHIVFIGAGKMGEAIISGWLSSQVAPADALSSQNITAVERSEARCAYLKETYGVSCFADTSQIKAADIVVLAVKPQVMIAAIESLSNLEAFQSALFISIAAGMTTHDLSGVLPERSSLVRVMPNLPLVVGEGASAVCASQSSQPSDVEMVKSLFSCLGQAEIVEEDLMDAVCAVSGSGPAYVAAVIEAMVKAAEKQGIPSELAQKLALQTVYGTALQLKETGSSAQELREAVSSPGGTTLAALNAMEQAGLQEVFEKGIVAAVQRSKELATCQS